MVNVFVELGERKSFAGAVDWPGWCRWGKGGEDAALEALAQYASRYDAVAERADVSLPRRPGVFKVVERMPGTATTDFGAPGVIGDCDAAAITALRAARFRALLVACWDMFDEVVATSPSQLRKGPRGGGRDRDKMVAHVLDAEAAYARKIGVRMKAPAYTDTAAVQQLRAAICEVLDAPSDGEPLGEKGWPARYAFRRIAWHVTDHAWEMEDRRTQ